MILPVLHYPHKNLRIEAKPVQIINAQIRELVSNMFETMYAESGIGLAATQVDYHKRVIVIDIADNKTKPLCLINPQIIFKSGDIEWQEGCLSVPDYRENVKRANQIKISALDENNNSFELEAQELLSVCIQHEIDHLNGVLFVDYLSKLKQKRLLSKINKKRPLHKLKQY